MHMTRPITRLAAAVVVVFCSVITPTGLAGAQTSPSHPAAFTVTAPSRPLPAEAGIEIVATVEIHNRLAQATTYGVKVVPVVPGDEGRLALGGPGGPMIDGASVPAQVTVAGSDSAEVPVRLSVPSTLPPNFYFVGLLITPETGAGSTGGTVTVQALQHLVVEVPGAAERIVSTQVAASPRVALHGALDGHVHFVNDAGTGAQVRPSGEVRRLIGFGLRNRPLEIAGAPEIVASGTRKSVAYRYRSAGYTLALATIDVRSNTGGTQDVERQTGRSPVVLVASTGGALTLLTAFVLTFAASLALIVRALSKRTPLPRKWRQKGER